LADGGVRVIDLETGVLRHDLRLHEAPVEALAFATDCTQLVTASRDGAIGVWDLGDGRLLRRIRAGRAPGALALTRDGTKAVFAFGGHTIHVWDTVESKRLRLFRLKGRPVLTLATSADVDRLALGCEDGQLLLVHAGDAAATTAVTCEAPVRALALDAAGGLAFYAVGDRTIRVWDVVRNTQLPSLPREVLPVVAMASDAEGQRLVSVTNLTLSAFDVMRATRVSVQTVARGWSACAVSGDGLVVAGGGPDGRVESFRLPAVKGRGGAEGESDRPILRGSR
jgi:WD40 repeat protein